MFYTHINPGTHTHTVVGPNMANALTNAHTHTLIVSKVRMFLEYTQESLKHTLSQTKLNMAGVLSTRYPFSKSSCQTREVFWKLKDWRSLEQHHHLCGSHVPSNIVTYVWLLCVGACLCLMVFLVHTPVSPRVSGCCALCF